MPILSWRWIAVGALPLALLLPSCGGSNSGPQTPSATATPLPTATPSATPTPQPTATMQPTATPTATATPLPASRVTSATFGLTLNPDNATYRDAIAGIKSGELTDKTFTLMARGIRSFDPMSLRYNTVSLGLTGNQTIGAGDIFVVGSQLPAASFSVSKRASYRAVSGQVRVVSKSASGLTLQLTDVVAQSSSNAADTVTFNGPIEVTLS